MRKTKVFPWKQLPIIFICWSAVFIFQSCQKTIEPSSGGEEIATKRKPQNPPQPPQFYFSNCGFPVISGTFVAGVPANVTVTFNYVNSPGGSHSGYTSSTVAGITFTTPPGTLNVGSGSITYSASGTPTGTGQVMAIVGLNGFTVGCGFVINILNAPSNCGITTDPAAAEGSTGCVVFMYRGQQVSYSTVRAADGRIWLQQNLGSPQVAGYAFDEASFGHYFQWGRWDDGHQLPNSSVVPHNSSLENPSHIAGGNSNFISNSSTNSGWWGTGSSNDTWNGTLISTTNGKDPCAALGSGWHLPSRTEWQNLVNLEDIFSAFSGYHSNLKLTSSGYRWAAGGQFNSWAPAYYWSSTADNNGLAYHLFYDDNYIVVLQQAERGYGFPCRCVKD